MKHRTLCKQILLFYTPSTPGWGQKFFLKKVMLHINYKEKSLEKYASKMFGLNYAHTDLLEWVKMSDIEIVQISIF